MLQISPNQQINPPRCECHECTQARWKMSFQGQLGLGNYPSAQGELKGISSAEENRSRGVRI